MEGRLKICLEAKLDIGGSVAVFDVRHKLHEINPKRRHDVFVSNMIQQETT